MFILQLFAAAFLVCLSGRLTDANGLCESASSELVLAIDTTGSMSSAIAAVRQRCIDLVNTALTGTDAALPEGFVLSPFNDPQVGPLQKFATSQSSAFIAAISRLSADGGGDTPELCLEGILAASRESRDGAIIHVFTDAPTKNPGLLAEVLASVQRKRQMVNFIIPNLWFEGDVTYNQIAATTSGLFIKTGTTLSDIYAATLLLDEGGSNCGVILIKVEKSASRSQTLGVGVDSSMKMLEVVLQDDTSAPFAVFTPPTGSKSRSFPVAPVFSSGSTRIYRIADPAPGNWLVSVEGTKPGWSAQVRGRSAIDFSYALGSLAGSVFDELEGDPSVGQTVQLQITLACEGCVAERVQLLSDGIVMMDFPAPVHTPGGSTFYIEFVVPSNVLAVIITGRDEDGVQFKRTHRTLIRPDATLRRPPTCTTVSSSFEGGCSVVGGDPVNCRNTRWQVQMKFDDPEKQLRTVKYTRENSLGLATWSLPTEVWRISNVTVTGTATGTCCTTALNFEVGSGSGMIKKCAIRR